VESIFGKYKHWVEKSPQKAITRLILAIGALTSTRKPELVKQAMETVKMESVEEWFRKYVPQDARSIRQEAFA
jgi:Zn finger protein HypA/HybF involved in hydrogenase expression